MRSLDGRPLLASDNFAKVMTRAFVSSAVLLLLATPRILLHHVHDPTCLDDCPEVLWSVLNLQAAIANCSQCRQGSAAQQQFHRSLSMLMHDSSCLCPRSAGSHVLFLHFADYILMGLKRQVIHANICPVTIVLYVSQYPCT